jgi:hypothetical protein
MPMSEPGFGKEVTGAVTKIVDVGYDSQTVG